MENRQRVTQAVVTSQGTVDPKQLTEKIAFFNTDGTPYDFGDQADANDVLMTGYAPHAVGNVAAADTLNVAVAKLEARIAALEA